MSAIADCLAARTWRWRDEYELQQLLADTLTAAGFVVEREVRLSRRSRIDLLVDGRTGLEVKVAGTPAEVFKQLHRYASHDVVEHLVLFTTKARHLALQGLLIGAVPVEVVRARWV